MVLRRLAGRVLRGALSALPLNVRDHVFRIACEYASRPESHRFGLYSMEGALELVRQNGFRPRAIVDIGAYIGDWSRIARRVFPEVPLVMIDGNPENDAALRAAAQTMGPDARHLTALLGPEARERVTIFQNGTGTSVLKELTTLRTRQVETPMRTLDSLLKQESLSGPLLLKLDVQGFELEVLRGATSTMREAELVLLEVSTIPFNENAPLFAEVVAFMATAGYVAFDFGGQARRQTDHALFQLDVLFVRRNSELLRKRKFWLFEP